MTIVERNLRLTEAAALHCFKSDCPHMSLSAVVN